MLNIKQTNVDVKERMMSLAEERFHRVKRLVDILVQSNPEYKEAYERAFHISQTEGRRSFWPVFNNMAFYEDIVLTDLVWMHRMSECEDTITSAYVVEKQCLAQPVQKVESFVEESIHWSKESILCLILSSV